MNHNIITWQEAIEIMNDVFEKQKYFMETKIMRICYYALMKAPLNEESLRVLCAHCYLNTTPPFEYNQEIWNKIHNQVF
jgi:hypothetical protein